MPLPQELCDGCDTKLAKTAFLLEDTEADALVVFCGECALWAQVMQHQRYLLIPT
jgi:hypothetical protein